MYAREHDNKVTIRCNAPNGAGMKQFWTEVQEYMDKGYRYSFANETGLMMESPVGQTFSRVTLELPSDVSTDHTIDPSDQIEETPVVTEEETPVVTEEETPVTVKPAAKKPTPKKATAKKPAAKK